MARIWRDGQTKPCFVHRMLTTGTIEEKVSRALAGNEQLPGMALLMNDGLAASAWLPIDAMAGNPARNKQQAQLALSLAQVTILRAPLGAQVAWEVYGSASTLRLS
eukprot:GHRR01034934.1.p2 GENE.GHRR01034934.1~~GHRR01034934.1.p2  ORF type:complete len:106 (-),score=27.41 GHRR01034934.1:413-730(-)